MALVEAGDVAATVHAPVRLGSLRHLLDGEPGGLERAGEWVFSRDWLGQLENAVRERIAGADPLDPGVPLPAGEWAPEIVPLLPFERRGAKLYEPGAAASLTHRESEAAELERILAEAGVRATKVEDPELARLLEAQGRLVRLGREHAIGREAYDAAREALLRECREAGEIALARFRDLLGVGRRDAQLLLERFDQDGITRRVGDRRVLRRAATRATRG
jgi:hypothetical protein